MFYDYMKNFNCKLCWFYPLKLQDIGIDKKYISYQDNIMSLIEFKIDKVPFLLMIEKGSINFIMEYVLEENVRIELMNFIREYFHIPNIVQSGLFNLLHDEKQKFMINNNQLSDITFLITNGLNLPIELNLPNNPEYTTISKYGDHPIYLSEPRDV